MENPTVTITKQEYLDILRDCYSTQAYLQMRKDTFWTESTVLQKEEDLRELTDATLKKTY